MLEVFFHLEHERDGTSTVVGSKAVWPFGLWGIFFFKLFSWAPRLDQTNRRRLVGATRGDDVAMARACTSPSASDVAPKRATWAAADEVARHHVH